MHAFEKSLPRTPYFPTTLESASQPSYGAVNPTAKESHLRNSSSFSSFHASFMRKYSLPIDSKGINSEYYDHSNPTSPKRTAAWLVKVEQLIIDWWLWEILSWIISAICMGGIALVLGLYNNKALPSHWPGGISLNTFISVLSSIAKYGLAVPVEGALGQLKWIWFQSAPSRKLIDFERFDEAVRGPYGSLGLISHLKGRSLASLGASIVVLSLALDPFFQQIVAYPKRPGYLGNSTITRSITFNPKLEVYEINGTKLWPAIDQAYYAAETSLYGGGGGGNSEVFCPSGVCEWPEFDTLGVCSTCNDVSHLLDFTCTQEPGTWLSNRTAFTNFTEGTPVTSCGYFINSSSSQPTLMSGYVLNSGNSSGRAGEALLMRTLPLLYIELNQSWWDRSYSFKSTRDTLPLNDFIISMNTDIESVYANKTPQVQECVLQWCTKRIAASFKDGNYDEKIVSTFKNNTVVPIPYVWERYKDQYNDKPSIRYYGNISITPPNQSTTYSVSNTTVWEFMIPMKELIPSFVTSRNTSSLPILRVNQQPGKDIINSKPFNLTEWLHTKNISDYIEDLSTALTNVVRTYPGSSEVVLGYGGLETYIRIQWAWFSLPVIILMSTLFLLIMTIIRGPTKSEGGIWKTSSLAVLLNGLDNDSRAAMGESWRMAEVRARARQLDVALTTEFDGYKLRQVQEVFHENI